MKKIIYIIILLSLTSVWWYFGYKYYKNSNNNPLISNKTLSEKLKNLQEENKTLLNEEIIKTKDEKIETLRKRFSLRWTISRWDGFFEWNQLILAINEYNKALKQNPKDEQIIKKIALTNFELKRYQDAVLQFSKVESFLNNSELNNYILALIYLTNYKSQENINITLNKIDSLNISAEEKFYYKTAITSTIDFHMAKKLFDDYIALNPNITFPPLINLKKSIINYNNFKLNEIYYKDALIIWSLFQNKLFSISNILSANLLNEKWNYTPMLLVIWKWYYELWYLKEAKKYLERYYKLEPTDSKITYILWTINFKLKEYIISNLYYNAALKNWFEPKIELERKLVYNYYLANDKKSMLNMFSYLLNEENANIEDFSLWIYHAILEWRILNAINRSNKWLQKFNWQTWYEVFYAYLWWIEREAKNLDKSREYLAAWLRINPKDPLLTLNMWYLEETNWNYQMALIYLKRTVNINWDWEFWELAWREIEEIEKIISKLQQTQSWVSLNWNIISQ